jgi:hypothetical protein
MIVPDFWAEARKQHRTARRQVTVRRFGWSTTSQADAQAMAEARAEEALQGFLSGQKIPRHEHKVAYNGAEGLPIREEVLSRHGDEVISRNSYGAHCLNSPHALFADVDFDNMQGYGPFFLAFAPLAVVSVAMGIWFRNGWVAGGLFVASGYAAFLIAEVLRGYALRSNGKLEQKARDRIVAFLAANPTWNARLYRTPAGFRVLATHQPFDARSEEVRRFFTALRVDSVYVRMCINQNCFRARLTAKPWRIGIPDNMRPRPGVWPIRPESMAQRTAWIAKYEAKAADVASCRYVESLGSGSVHYQLRSVIELHDRESRAMVRDIPIA